MALAAFHHGVEVDEVDDGARPLRTLATDVIGLVGSAPGQWTAAGPAATNKLNAPVLLRSRADGAKYAGVGVGTIPDALEAIWGQGISPPIVMVNVLNPAAHKTAVARKTLTLKAGTVSLGDAYVQSVQVLGAATAVAESDQTLTGDSVTLGASGDYITDLVVKDSTGSTTYAEGTDWTFVAGTRVLSRVSAGGIAANATLKVVWNKGTLHAVGTDYTLDAAKGTVTRVAGGGIGSATDTIRVTYDKLNPAGVAAADVAGVPDPGDGMATGVRALDGAESEVFVKPKILIAPSHSKQQTVTAALLATAAKLRAVTVADGPDTTDDAAISFVGNFDDRRLYVVDPGVKVKDANDQTVKRPGSAYAAGVIAKSDSERGYWWSPSNRPILGIVGTGRPVDYSIDDASSRANHLNNNKIATIIREQGWRLWGNRTSASDAKWAFLSVVRTADAIDEAILRSHLWAVDRNITRTYLEDVAAGVNAYLRQLEAQGGIVGGSCVPSPDLNNAASIQAGRAYWDVEFTPVYPAERLTFRRRIDNDRLEELVA